MSGPLYYSSVVLHRGPGARLRNPGRIQPTAMRLRPSASERWSSRSTATPRRRGNSTAPWPCTTRSGGRRRRKPSKRSHRPTRPAAWPIGAGRWSFSTTRSPGRPIWPRSSRTSSLRSRPRAPRASGASARRTMSRRSRCSCATMRRWTTARGCRPTTTRWRKSPAATPTTRRRRFFRRS